MRGKMVPPLAVYLACMAAMQLIRAAVSSGPPLTQDLVELKPGTFFYRSSGEFSRSGKTIVPPMVLAAIGDHLYIMKHQVTSAEYQRCVEAKACSKISTDAPAEYQPVVKISWLDATAYAHWLSNATGSVFRLPTDEEWAFAAAERFSDDGAANGSDATDPGQSALAAYARDVARSEAIDRSPRRLGSFGANANGLLDMAGNVWEWTSTCYVRTTIDRRSSVVAATRNCGVRVVEGAHRTYLTDFIRDPRAGGCSIGVPPSNLGFRLLRDDSLSLPAWITIRALRLMGSD